MSSDKNWFASLRASLFTGALALAPLSITLFVFYKIFTYIDGFRNVIPSRWIPESSLIFHIPGLGVFISLVLVTMFGWLMRYYVGRRIINFTEQLLETLPIVSSVYQGLKQLIETLFSNQGSQFREVVVIEYPRKGVFCFAFVTNTDNYITQEQDLISIFLPTTPNPTSGFFLLVPIEQVRKVDMSVEEAFKLIMSAGLVVPPECRNTTPYKKAPTDEMDSSEPKEASEQNPSSPIIK